MKIEVSLNPDAGGTVSINDSVATSYPAIRTLPEEAVIQLEAKPMEGYRFDGWSGDLTGVENPITVELDSHKYITANFSPAAYMINIGVDGGGTTSLETGDHKYNSGSEIDITAIPDDGWNFAGWIGDVADQTSSTTTVMVDRDKNVTARFNPIMHTLTVYYDYNGGDASTSGPYSYREGTVVDLLITQENGWRFDGWEGDVADPTSTNTTVFIDSDKYITANFIRSGPDPRIIGIIAGSAGAGVLAFFMTGQKRGNKKSTTSKVE